MITIVHEKSTHQDFRQLVQELDADLNARYGVLLATYNQHNVVDDIQSWATSTAGRLDAGP